MFVFSKNPLYLYDCVRRCLFAEMELIKDAGGDYSLFPTGFEIPNSAIEVTRKITILRNRTQETAEDLSKMKQEQEAFVLQYHELTKLNAAIQQMQPLNQPNNIQLTTKLREKENLELLLTQKIARLVQLRMGLLDKLKESYQLLNALQIQVLDEELMR